MKTETERRAFGLHPSATVNIDRPPRASGHKITPFPPPTAPTCTDLGAAPSAAMTSMLYKLGADGNISIEMK